MDAWLASLYFNRNQTMWGLTTVGLIVVPLGLCQMYSLWLLRTDNYPIRAAALGMHILLLGIPYRYHGILRRVEQDKSGHHHNSARVQAIRHQISDANAIQTMNATFQYCPQFLFQSFLIVYRRYKCILTGVSAGLAAFSFLWHIFIHFYYLVKRYHETDPQDCLERCYHQAANPAASLTAQPTPHIIDNLSTTAASSVVYPVTPIPTLSPAPTRSGLQQSPNAAVTASTTTTAHLHTSGTASGPSSLISNNHSQTSTSLTDSLRNFEKPQYKTDDNNLMSKRGAASKMVEKSKIFGFNKRRPIYQQPHEDFDIMNESPTLGATTLPNNTSTVFFEIDDSRMSNATGFSGCAANSSSLAASKFNVSLMSNSKDMDNFLNENHSNTNVLLAKKTFNDYKYNFGGCDDCTLADDDDDDDMDDLKREKQLMNSSSAMQHQLMDSTAATHDSRGEHQQLPYPHHQHHHHHHHCNRNSLLKRKGICSSQEMLHLVDIMNDQITAEQVDVLAKSLVELGDVSLPATETSASSLVALEPNMNMDPHHAHHLQRLHQHGTSAVDLDNTKLLLDHFPEQIDDRRLLENIDAAIYENQIIFQERIRKNQLTIQNLKLQDQLLSKCIEDMKTCGSAAAAASALDAGGISAVVAAAVAAVRNQAANAGLNNTGTAGSEMLSVRDYENMCFTNIARQQRGMKHWRNYFQDMDTSAHDGSTVQHSSYYVNTNTMSNSTSADLYINEEEDDDDNVTTASMADADDGGASTVIIHDDIDDVNEHDENDDDDNDDEEHDDDADDDDDDKETSVSGHASNALKKGVRWSCELAAAPMPPRRLLQRRMLRPDHHHQQQQRFVGHSGENVPLSSSGDTAQSDDLYINMSNHDDGVASAISMDASTATTRGSNSSVVVELDDDEADDTPEDDDDDEGAVVLPQKNILVETINKINVDSPVKNLLGNGKVGGNGTMQLTD